MLILLDVKWKYILDHSNIIGGKAMMMPAIRTLRTQYGAWEQLSTDFNDYQNHVPSRQQIYWAMTVHKCNDHPYTFLKTRLCL
jgi:hypothetical protein